MKKEKTALVIIDLQKHYCDPQTNRRMGCFETVQVAKDIARLAPAFRKAGVPIIALYADRHNINLDRDSVDFFEFAPAKSDIVIGKKKESAFSNPAFEKTLREQGITTLYLCGVNFNCCVAATAFDAKERGFKVHVLDDITGNDMNHNYTDRLSIMKDFKEAGVRLEESGNILRHERLERKKHGKDALVK